MPPNVNVYGPSLGIGFISTLCMLRRVYGSSVVNRGLLVNIKPFPVL